MTQTFIKKRYTYPVARTLSIPVALGILCLCLSGCQSLSLFSSPIQKRGVTGFFKDNLLRAQITKKLLRTYKGSISTLIHKGKVMVVGYVQTEKDHETVVTSIRGLKGVGPIADHLIVGKAPEDPLNDTYLSQSLQSALFFDTRIRSQNYHITASHKTLYILGTAGSEDEKKSVLNHAEKMTVRHVISDISIESQNASKQESQGQSGDSHAIPG